MNAMDRRQFLRHAGGMAAAAAVPGMHACAAPDEAAVASGPNLLLIMADDLGFADIGAFGGSGSMTPALDALAAEGVRLTQAYSAAPVCSPTRVALMTGRYPAREEVGLHEPLTTQPIGLAPELPTLSRRLKEAGYETALVGKWHLGLDRDFHPLRHGFDEFFGHLGAAIDYVTKEGTEHRAHDLFDGYEPVHTEEYATDLFTDRAVEIITRPRARPFFLSLQYNAPHWPWQAPGDGAYPDSLRWALGGSPQTYARMVERLDAGVARVLGALRERGADADTLVLFTSDNGGERWSDMGPLRDRKMTLWEGGIRVCAMARWPGVIPQGRTIGQVAITMDWTATLLAAAGVRPHPSSPLDGIDLRPQLIGASAPVPRELFWRTFQRTRHKAVRSGDWKYLVTPEGEHLFRLDDDVSERINRVSEFSDVLARLRGALAAWEEEMLEPIPLDPRFA
jgi:arylsulfatase A-like enzyme